MTKPKSENVTLVWETLSITEKANDEINFTQLPHGVKINQFPGLYVIGRKDYLWLNYQKMLSKHGPSHFNFLSRTYVLPDDYELCTEDMKKNKKVMIIKPPNYYCGIGIKLINKTGEFFLAIKPLLIIFLTADEPF